MTLIICSANSLKMGERCIAGINPDTGQWIRPVSDLPDGRIPKAMRLIDGREPALLDILEIPLAQTGRDFGFERENLDILPGKWRKVGRASRSDLLQFCDRGEQILHNDSRYVTVPYLQSLPLAERRTLQLVLAEEFSASREFNKWKGYLVTSTKQRLNAKITDPVLVESLDDGDSPEAPCFVTVSLSMPWPPPDWEGDDPCWKLIAGVV